MITFILSVGLFTCGIIAACIDWHNFMNFLFRFDPVVLKIKSSKYNPKYNFHGATVEHDGDFVVIHQ